MFGIGSTELVVILVFGFLLFGPDKLPHMGRTIGRALRQFRETQEKLTAVVQTEVVDPMAAAVNGSAKPTGSGTDPAGDAPIDPAADDGDAEAGSESAAQAPRKETFAERRARLAAEREAKAAAEAEGEGDSEGAGVATALSAVQEPSSTSAGSGDGDSQAESARAAMEKDGSHEGQGDQGEDPAARELTTEDLYARRPRRRAMGHEEAAAEGGDR